MTFKTYTARKNATRAAKEAIEKLGEEFRPLMAFEVAETPDGKFMPRLFNAQPLPMGFVDAPLLGQQITDLGFAYRLTGGDDHGVVTPVPAATVATERLTDEDAIEALVDAANAVGAETPAADAIIADGVASLTAVGFVDMDVVAPGPAPTPAADGMAAFLAVADQAATEALANRSADRVRGGRRAAVQAAASAGVLPAAPDFSAETHKRWRGKLAAVVAMVEAGDVDGLRALEIPTYSTSPKAIARYRDLAVAALTARAAGVAA
ncbi:MAG: hypothetical protein ACK53W_13495 [Gemmatimonadota bacterium]